MSPTKADRENAQEITLAWSANRNVTLIHRGSNLVDLIAKALADERERCAKIVKTGDWGIMDGGFIKEKIAAAIRKGTP